MARSTLVIISKYCFVLGSQGRMSEKSRESRGFDTYNVACPLVGLVACWYLGYSLFSRSDRTIAHCGTQVFRTHNVTEIFQLAFYRAAWNAVCPSVCLSNACIVTERKKDMFRFLHHTKDHLS